MAKGIYATVGNTTKKVKKLYAAIGGVTKKIKKVYAVIDGKTRLLFNSEYTKVSVTSNTLQGEYRFYNGGTDIALPYNGNSNVLEYYTGILPDIDKTYLYNISENTITEGAKTRTVDVDAYDGLASKDGYIYVLSASMDKVYKIKQSDYSVVLEASVTSVPSSYYLLSKAIVEIDDYVYYFLYDQGSSAYRTYLYSLNKNTLEFKRISSTTDYVSLSSSRYADAVAKDGYIYYFNTYTSSGSSNTSLYCYRYDTNGNKTMMFVLYDNFLGSGYNVLRAMELDGVTYLFVGNGYQQANKVYTVDYENNTLNLFAELDTPCYVESWVHNGSGTIISTYVSATSNKFTKIVFE